MEIPLYSVYHNVLKVLRIQIYLALCAANYFYVKRWIFCKDRHSLNRSHNICSMIFLEPQSTATGYQIAALESYD